MKPLRICLVSAEVAPLAKTGGLADVTAALGRELQRRGHDVRVYMPLYRRVRESGRPLQPVPGTERLHVALGPRQGTVSIHRCLVEESGLEVLCVDAPALYDRPGIYTDDPDEHARFALLARAALSACQQSAWSPDIVHCNDWHVALIPLYLRMLRSWERLFARTRTVLTIHNIGYQGVVPATAIDDLGLADARHLLHQEDLSRGVINCLKTGILYADALTTVSRTYAREIQGEELGMGLHELLRGRAERLVGIVNGVDPSVWSPERDAFIPRRYSAATLERKEENKRALLAAVGLPPADGAPVFGIVSRLVGQKGFELLFEPVPEMLARTDARLVVLGSGEARYEAWFGALAGRFPRQVRHLAGYHEELAHLIEAGADAFLMPSRYEPCGLNQMYSLAYGTVPVVRKTGGLADTVQLFDPNTGQGTGVVFDHFDSHAVRWALGYTLDLWRQPHLWRRMQRNGMAQDFSWGRQVKEYEALYRRLLAEAATKAASPGSAPG